MCLFLKYMGIIQVCECIVPTMLLRQTCSRCIYPGESESHHLIMSHSATSDTKNESDSHREEYAQ